MKVMDKKDMKNEVNYRLAKMLILSLYKNGSLTLDDAEKLRTGMEEYYKPPIGCLDGGIE
jgi:trans-2-enoyl-CoA reductase